MSACQQVTVDGTSPDPPDDPDPDPPDAPQLSVSIDASSQDSGSIATSVTVSNVGDSTGTTMLAVNVTQNNMRQARETADISLSPGEEFENTFRFDGLPAGPSEVCVWAGEPPNRNARCVDVDVLGGSDPDPDPPDDPEPGPPSGGDGVFGQTTILAAGGLAAGAYFLTRNRGDGG
jgi:hypothetical protein